VISRDIAIVDVHPEHWINLVRGPGAPSGSPAGQGWLLLVHRSGRIVHAAHQGRRLPELLGQPKDDLAGLRRRYGARRVLCLERHFMRRTHARADSSLAYDMDYAQQMLILLDAFRTERGTGIELDPPTPPGPIPPFAWVQLAFDALWPDSTSILLYVVDEGREEIWTSLILRKRAGDLDLLATDLHLGVDGLRPGVWRTDSERVLSLVGARVARPYLACFASLSAFREWMAAPLGSDAFARLRAGRDLLLAPWPRRLAWPTALVRGFAAVARWMRPGRGVHEAIRRPRR